MNLHGNPGQASAETYERYGEQNKREIAKLAPKLVDKPVRYAVGRLLGRL